MPGNRRPIGRRTELVLLILLAADRPVYAREIELLFPDLPPRGVPNYLHRLAARGWVSAQLERPSTPNASRGRRVFYSVTPQGRVEGGRAVRAAAAADAAGAMRDGTVLQHVHDHCAAAVEALTAGGNGGDLLVESSLRGVAALFTAAAPQLMAAGEVAMAHRMASLGKRCEEAAVRWAATRARRSSYDRDMTWQLLRHVTAVLQELAAPA